MGYDIIILCVCVCAYLVWALAVDQHGLGEVVAAAVVTEQELVLGGDVQPVVELCRYTNNYL